MARPARGKDVLPRAWEALVQARTVKELRQAQAVILPLEFGFSLEQTAMVTGISKGWVCQLRNQFIRSAGMPDSEKQKPGGRRHENMSKEEEAAFLAPFFEAASKGGILVVRDIKQALDAHLGRTVPLSTVYNLLHRHNWRKLAPDKRHVKADVEAQADWKKIPGITCRSRQAVAGSRIVASVVSGRGPFWPDLVAEEVLVSTAASPRMPDYGDPGICLRLCRSISV